MPDSNDLPPLPPGMARLFTVDPDPDGKNDRWPTGLDDQAVADVLEQLSQPLTAADAAALRRGEHIDLALYSRTLDANALRAADQVPLPVEVDVYELMRAGMQLFYSIYYLNAEQAHDFIATMPDQVAEAYVRAGRAFAPHSRLLPDGEGDDAA